MLGALVQFQWVCQLPASCLLNFTICYWPFFFAVPPAYYAHLAAYRARYYMESESSEAGGSSTSRAAGGRPDVKFQRLPQVKDRVKEVMFYCWRWFLFSVVFSVADSMLFGFRMFWGCVVYGQHLLPLVHFFFVRRCHQSVHLQIAIVIT